MAAAPSNRDDKGGNDVFHSYFLWRLGLISDEVDWPSPSPGHAAAAGGDHAAANNDCCSLGAWRARDTLASLLGREASAVMSDTGLTTMESSLLDVEDTSTGNPPSFSSPFVPISAIMASVQPTQTREKHQNILSEEVCTVRNRRGQLDAECVQRAFDAAAFSVMRANRRAPLPTATASVGSDSGGALALRPAIDSIKLSGEGELRKYVPPLLRATEAVRTTRIAMLDKASGKSVPSFLKKNNTIPWFHVPDVTGKGGGAVKTAIKPVSTMTSLSTNLSAVGISTATPDATCVNYVYDRGKTDAMVKKCKKESGDVVKKVKNVDQRNAVKKQYIADVSCSKNTRPKVDRKRELPSSGSAKENDKLSASSRKKEKKSEKKADTFAKPGDGAKKTRKRAAVLTPSSKHGLASPASKSKKVMGCSPASVDEDRICAKENSAATRAIISAAAAGVFRELSPNHFEDSRKFEIAAENNPLAKDKKKKVNVDRMDATELVHQAKRLCDCVSDRAMLAARLGDGRRKFREYAAFLGLGTGALFRRSLIEIEGGNQLFMAPAHTLPLVVPNPFVATDANIGSDVENEIGNPNSGVSHYEEMLNGGPAKKLNYDREWTESCLPRLLEVLDKGAGHAILHDREWNGRAFRVADLLQRIATVRSPVRRPNYGPHLVVTSDGEDFDRFQSVFAKLGYGLHGIVGKGDRSTTSDSNKVSLRVMPYRGRKICRTRLRRHFGSIFPPAGSHHSFLGGLPSSPFHIVLTTYSSLLEDFAHFCQIPFQVVLLDEGMSWLGCACSDPHGKLGRAWASGFWSRLEYRTGTVPGFWDFNKDSIGPEADEKHNSVSSSTVERNSAADSNGGMKVPMGLIWRYRVLTASNMHTRFNDELYKAPVLGLLSFLAPQLAEAVGEDWERSRIFSCDSSMSHLRSLVARCVVVYFGGSSIRDPVDLVAMSLKALEGELPLRSYLAGQDDDDLIEKLVKSQKVVQSRKFAAAWFQHGSPVIKELATVSLEPILTALKKKNVEGFVCEEVVTASNLTSALGLAAYRPATRCGKSFNSEQGLKQHILSMHAPAGTWLCSSCGGDCGTSQARTLHERACKQGASGGTALNAGQETRKPRGPKKKEIKTPPMPEGNVRAEETIGFTKVPGYRGVWMQPDGKYLVKINGKLLANDNSGKRSPFLFDTVQDAAKKFDEVITECGEAQELEMNYGADGSRIVHEGGVEDVSIGKSSEAVGSGATSVTSSAVPALSVINIKNLPPHVKPLLRDPNWTSRTGGNSKRYVYAYRGVCRQQRKGHDRWQSQISFNGTNHYLGTFDSEWDAAAVYAWAHLILYGEEATRKAQLEGEEAAAAFAQHEKDVAEGKAPPPSPKPTKKKKRGAPRKMKVEVGGAASGHRLKEEARVEFPAKDNGNFLGSESPALSLHGKKKRPASMKDWNKLKTDCAMMLSSGTKGTSKASILATRRDIAEMSEKLLLPTISGKDTPVSEFFLQQSRQGVIEKCPRFPSCAPLSRFSPRILCTGNALLIGLQSCDFGWDLEKFMKNFQVVGSQYALAASSALLSEFGADGTNRLFRTLLLSPSCALGRAPKGYVNKFLPTDFIGSTLGMAIGDLCNIGGPEHSCSELAAKIEFMPSKFSNFQIMACNGDDIVTLNGQRINLLGQPFPLRNRDVCSIGARVFVFIEKI